MTEPTPSGSKLGYYTGHARQEWKSAIRNLNVACLLIFGPEEFRLSMQRTTGADFTTDDVMGIDPATLEFAAKEGHGGRRHESLEIAPSREARLDMLCNILNSTMKAETVLNQAVSVASSPAEVRNAEAKIMQSLNDLQRYAGRIEATWSPCHPGWRHGEENPDQCLSMARIEIKEARRLFGVAHHIAADGRGNMEPGDKQLRKHRNEHYRTMQLSADLDELLWQREILEAHFPQENPALRASEKQLAQKLALWREQTKQLQEDAGYFNPPRTMGEIDFLETKRKNYLPTVEDTIASVRQWITELRAAVPPVQSQPSAAFVPEEVNLHVLSSDYAPDSPKWQKFVQEQEAKRLEETKKKTGKKRNKHRLSVPTHDAPTYQEPDPIDALIKRAERMTERCRDLEGDAPKPSLGRR